jgi:hypothetical protein
VLARIAAWTLLPMLLALPGAAANFAWVDEAGVTHITNDPAQVPDPLRNRAPGPEALRSIWNGPVDRSAPPASTALDQDEERTQRQLRAAVDDLVRGENARAAAKLRSLLREQPGRPEPHWYLAQLDRYRGRYDSAAAHLDAFLATAGDGLEPWRDSARLRLAALADERRLTEHTRGSASAPWRELSSPNFRVELDPDLGRAAPDYASTVLRYLEEARTSVAERLGAQPDEPMGVVFYGRASYDEAHGDRFSFRTVGFFDGRIHVVSAAHPAGELRALLFHEYTHAVFRERTGGDHPYWLNEGLAELSERASRGQPGLTRSERAQLKRRIDAGEWLPLRRLAPSFSGLEDEDAGIAYLESTAAADWLGARTDRATRGRLLERIGAGASNDEALREVLGMDTDAIDAAVREWIGSEFAGRLPRPGSIVH